MNKKIISYPLVTIIIPVKPGRRVGALECIKWLDYPAERMEVLVSEGNQPSRQRNEAAGRAKGEILFFLDDDSCPAPDALKRIAAHFEDEDVAAAGGPSITPEGDSHLQRSFGAALSSFFGGFSIRNRYRRIGAARETSENELILCNLAFRRSYFIEEGGLNERLYPNEENELMNRLQKRGYKLIHDPDVYVLRSQRKGMYDFFRQMLSYGRGRAEQTLADPYSFKASHLAPSLFLLYFLSTPFSGSIGYLIPLVCYAMTNILSSVLLALKEKNLRFLYMLPAVYLAMHLCYGAGVIWGGVRGLTGSIKARPGEVVIRYVKQVA